jgi:hypothetical protein
LNLVAEEDADWGGSIHQPVSLTVYPQPKISNLYPTASNSQREHVQILFENDAVISQLIEADSDASCCVDSSTCSPVCLAKCRIYSPGRQALLSEEPMALAGGSPACALPTYDNSIASCSDEMSFLEIEIILDEYLPVEWSIQNRFGCLKDTEVYPSSVPQQILYQKPAQPRTQERFQLNGTNFRAELEQEDAKCLIRDSDGNAVLTTPVEFNPHVHAG